MLHSNHMGDITQALLLYKFPDQTLAHFCYVTSEKTIFYAGNSCVI